MTTLPNSTEFHLRDGQLHAEGIALAAIAQEVGTPFYCYSAGAMRRAYATFVDALDGLPASVCYAVKANGNIAVIRTFADMGAGADVVSEGEIHKALAAGVPPERIVFSGVGKTEQELEFALGAGVTHINVESDPELDMLSAVATRLGVTASVALRLNPDVDARTHAKISTGRKEDKFGIPLNRAVEVYARADDLSGISAEGLAVHIGSQLMDLEPFRKAFQAVAGRVRALRADVYSVHRLDLGGGLGIAYDDGHGPDASEYGAIVRDTVGDLGCQLVFEPGRSMVGNAGVLVTRVILVKEGESRRFAVVDAAMNDLKRPALYGAHHAIVPVATPAPGTTPQPYDVVGPVCETGDTFATERPLPPVEAGDLLALGSAGAYGAVMASTYNARPLIPEVLVDGDRFAVVRRRPTYDELLAQDSLPDWVDDPEGVDLQANGGDAPGAPPRIPRAARTGAG